MSKKWLPWKFILKKVARAQGFVDPIVLMSQFNRFAQPSEVLAPVELLRAGAVLHARGLINSQVIQHNLDWVWPYWARRQFDPRDSSFIPRAFSLTHINLTHRNWTAVGVPGFQELPIVDPRGLVTPFFDSWSIDGWVIPLNGENLIPSRTENAVQRVELRDSFVVTTEVSEDRNKIQSRAEVTIKNGTPVCQISYCGRSYGEAWLVAALRPYNPEGISFIHNIKLLHTGDGWNVNKEQFVFFSRQPDYYRFSHYRNGDVYHWIHSSMLSDCKSINCDIGLSTALAAWKFDGEKCDIQINIPLEREKKKPKNFSVGESKEQVWLRALGGKCDLEMEYGRFGELYETAIRTLLLHSPSHTFAGPYTYRRFWFRDAAFIVNALLGCGMITRCECIINTFFSHQNSDGYFLSQQGEWDSNGEALWVMQRYCMVSGSKTPAAWKNAIVKGADWIIKKRISSELPNVYAGLFPPGFSAEHLGPNDYYYWDDFWGIAGLRAAAWLLDSLGEQEYSKRYSYEADEFMKSVLKSLKKVAGSHRRPIMPASPFRRPDSGAVGSLAVGYPLQLWKPDDKHLKLTAEYLYEKCLIDNAFYHDISHSGINPYLTLHIAQVLMRASDIRFADLMESIAVLSSETGQWPEAIHPQLKTGCMGDGQHVWAAAEWVLIIRSCFVSEETDPPVLVLCRGIYEKIMEKVKKLYFGPSPTIFGLVSIQITNNKKETVIEWEGKWHNGKEPCIVIDFPEKKPLRVETGTSKVILTR